MKRLIRKADNNINEPKIEDIQRDENSQTNMPMIDNDMAKRLRDEVKNDFENENNTNMILLDELDEADVRHDKCPQCKCQPIIRKEGFKICPSCGMIYKVLDGKGYAVIS